MMENGSYIGRATIKEKTQPEFMDLEVPEFGGKIRLRRIDIGERGQMTDARASGENDMQLAARMVILSMVDSGGQRLYTDEEVGEVLRWPPEPLQRIADAAYEFSKVRTIDLEGAEKNSVIRQSSDSSAN